MPDNNNPMDALMEVFMVETNDFLSKLEELLINHEKSEGGIRQATAEIFRIMHTIKSSSAMMSLENISKLAHKIEDLFYYLRENPDIDVDDSKLADIVLDAVDFIKGNLDGKEGEDPSPQIEFIDKYLNELKHGSPVATEIAPIKKNTAEPPAATALPQENPAASNKKITVFLRRETEMLGLRALELVNRLKKAFPGLTYLPEDTTADEESIAGAGLQLILQSDMSEPELIDLINKSPFVGRVAFGDKISAVNSSAAAKASGKPEAIRQFTEKRQDSPNYGKTFANVEITKLDNLVDLVGEILILQMELAQDIERTDYVKSEAAVGKLKKLILTLQEATLSTRMIPVRETFLKMNRIVRDMCRKQEKDIDFITTGEETEVDRSIIENINSPLMHIIRNSIDHGIEDQQSRLAAGKPSQGKIELSAATEGRNVVITVIDDGAGFDTERIRAKAIDVGLITENQSLGMSNEEINGLVFLPGFSTNAEVTEYSGRGVGMDVVNENMRKMNGKVIVLSEQGVGTKIVMKIPLTLAIIDTIILRVDSEVCAIPVSFVRKILHLGGDVKVRTVNGEDVVLLGEECYRILNLFDFYSYTERIPYEDGTMVLIDSDAKKYVAFVSEILDRQDVVVKPAPALFKTIKGISGCTILGDGKISLILDTDELLS